MAKAVMSITMSLGVRIFMAYRPELGIGEIHLHQHISAAQRRTRTSKIRSLRWLARAADVH